ncbi:MAG: acetolactate synthase [Planctomycetota bacterium]|nr:MAG: acetolactate synthase [Planctomycetota bacterium]
MTIEPLETQEAQGIPTVRQQSVFVENRVGQLLRLTQLFDKTEVRILAVSVVHSVDCAICRMILDPPDKAYDVLGAHDFQVSEIELLVVSLPPGRRALLHTWAALLRAEVNIHYTYPLLIRPYDAAALALLPDDLDGAARVLRAEQFRLLDQQDLGANRDEWH